MPTLKERIEEMEKQVEKEAERARGVLHYSKALADVLDSAREHATTLEADADVFIAGVLLNCGLTVDAVAMPEKAVEKKSKGPAVSNSAQRGKVVKKAPARSEESMKVDAEQMAQAAIDHVPPNRETFVPDISSASAAGENLSNSF